MSPIHQPSGPKPTLYELIEMQGYLSLDSMEGGMEATKPPVIQGSKWQLVPGIFLAVFVTLLANYLRGLPFAPFTIEGSSLRHPLGVSVLAILLGILVGVFWKLPTSVKLGSKWVAYWFIPVAIVFLGAGIDVSILGMIAGKLLCIILLVMLCAVFLATFLGRLCGLDKKTSFLLGVGSAVCGSSAILAVAPVSNADDEDVLVSVGVVNIIGLIAMFSCVASLWFYPLPADVFGALVGATIHAVPQVVAAGQSHGVEAATMATLVKLVRVACLAPLVLLCAIRFGARGQGVGEKRGANRLAWLSTLPWFIWGFLAMAVLRITGVLPVLHFEDGTVSSMTDLLGAGSKWLLAIAMAAIGLQVDLGKMLKSGAKAMLVGVLTWLIMALVAVGLLLYWMG